MKKSLQEQIAELQKEASPSESTGEGVAIVEIAPDSKPILFSEEPKEEPVVIKAGRPKKLK